MQYVDSFFVPHKSISNFTSSHNSICFSFCPYMKSTKTDVAAHRERAAGMWMESYADYLQHLLGEKGGTQDELLRYM